MTINCFPGEESTKVLIQSTINLSTGSTSRAQTEGWLLHDTPLEFRFKQWNMLYLDKEQSHN